MFTGAIWEHKVLYRFAPRNDGLSGGKSFCECSGNFWFRNLGFEF